VTPLRAIRIAMMLGVLLFGGVAWFITRTPDWKAPDPGLLDQLSMIARVGWIAIGIALVFMFLRFRDSPSPSRASTAAIVAWTLGETLALFGGVILFLTAFGGWYIAGVTALVLAFVAFPPPVNR
jgi:FtsH-binding integral membrane protein